MVAKNSIINTVGPTYKLTMGERKGKDKKKDIDGVYLRRVFQRDIFDI